jgi:hypothetical protein
VFVSFAIRGRYRLPVLLIVSLHSLPGIPHSVVAQEANPFGEWMQLDPGGSLPIRTFALSPSWPADQTIIAARSQPDPRNLGGRDIVRSPDGGRTWVRLPDPGFDINRLIVTDDGPSGRVVLASRRSDSPSDGDGALYRSADGGTSWQQVFEFARPSPSEAISFEIVLSPSFALDGNAFIVDSGILYGSIDGGLTWEKVPTDSGQRVRQVVFSPSFAQDETIFVLLSTGPLTWPRYAPRSPDEPLATANAQSLGILRSTDSGASWQQTATGLEVDGEPFRQVWNLTVSPTFNQDRTIFAFAWGPWQDVQSDPYQGNPFTARTVRTGLFRSSNAGESWNPILLTPTARMLPDGYRATVRLSRDFASDGWGVLNLNWFSLYYNSAHCNIFRTNDGGETWEAMPAKELAEIRLCWEFHAGRVGERRVLYALQPTDGVPGGSLPVWWWSVDDGATWKRLAFPEPIRYGPVGPVIAADGTVFFGGSGGLWALGPGARPPEILPSPVPTDGT